MNALSVLAAGFQPAEKCKHLGYMALNTLLNNKTIVLGLAIIFCCGIFAVLILMDPVSPDYTTTSETAADETQQLRKEQGSSDIEQPFEAIDPSAFRVAEGPDPTIIRPGTHIVGEDIQPGIYRGEAGSDILQSCYWARLQDLAGGPDSILAKENSLGPFMVQVLQSDFALSTACELQLVQ